MSQYELYRYIFLGAAIACGVLLVVSVVLLFTLKIPKVISDLTGRTARKAIENIRLQNEQSGDKTYQSSAVNLERGKLTDKISKSGRLIAQKETPFGTGVITEKISTQRLNPIEPADETTLLAADETTLLATNETTVLTGANETTVLDSGFGETTVLDVGQQNPAPAFVVEFEITYIHTSEVIPQEAMV